MRAAPQVPFGEAVRTWARIGLESFGGPAGQIAVMHRVLVEEKRWIDERRFLHALNYCMLLPGPEAQQLAIYVGWLLHRAKGGLVAGLLFVLPGALVMLALATLYVAYGAVPAVAAAFAGIQAGVLAVVVEALVRIGRRALATRTHLGLAAAGFVAIFILDVPFPFVVAVAALAGWLLLRPEEEPAQAVLPVRPSLVRSLRVLATGLVLWFAPLAAIRVWAGNESVFFGLGSFFSRAAVVTFGGAYAVLAYVAQQAVEVHGWLEPGQMLDGLGLAETTPGPLILVVEFVGFLGAHRNPGGLDPWLAGTLGAAVVLWVTFVPCFLWIFLGAPYVEALRGNRALSAALSGVTAAVTGVILNLAAWFALHVCFAKVEALRTVGLRLWVPEWASVRLAPLVIAALALFAMLRLRLGLGWTLAGCALAGWLLHLFA